MTRLLACVRSATEADAVLTAGFAGVVGAPPRADAVCGRIERGPAGALLMLDERGSTRRLALVEAGCPDASLLDALKPVHDGLLVTTEARIVDSPGLLSLGRLAAEARSRGLLLALGGGIEAGDVPRLLVLGPDLLLIGRALRDERGALDPGRIAALLALAEPPAAPASGAARDRIFVRDLILPVAIGVYASEYGRTQRVRFSVQASLRPAASGATGLASTVSYDLILDAIRRLTADRHVELVETLAEEIAAELLAVPRIAAVAITVEKLDVGPAVVGITIERSADPR